MKHSFLLLFLVISLGLFSQENFYIRGSITGYPGKKVSLYGFYGNKKISFDSTISDTGGKFTFSHLHKNYTGLYRLVYNKDKKFELIFNNENIEFTTSAAKPMENMTIISSKENELLYQYFRYKKKNDDKLTLLNQLVLHYPKNDPFYKNVLKQFIDIQKDELNYSNKLIKTNTGKYFINVVKFQQIPLIDPELNEQQQAEFLKKHYFDNISFADTLLLNSDLIPSKIISFLTLFMNKEFSPQQNEKSLMDATDIIMNKAKGYDKVYTFIFDFMLNGFEQLDMNKMMGYLIDNYEPGKICMGEYGNDNLDRRIESYKKLSVGKKAPEIDITDIDGKKVRLSQIPEMYTLVIFWHSDCPHCRHLLPIINSIYSSQKTKNFEVLAISIDTNKFTWMNIVKGENFHWINACELQGWNSKTVSNYSIYATPGMFLIDKSGTIVGKPTDEKQLRTLLKEKNLIP